MGCLMKMCFSLGLCVMFNLGEAILMRFYWLLWNLNCVTTGECVFWTCLFGSIYLVTRPLNYVGSTLRLEVLCRNR